MTDAPRPTRRRSIARAGVLVVVFLAIGAALNLGVAWWCEWNFKHQLDSRGGICAWTTTSSSLMMTATRIDELPARWTVDVPPNWPPPQRVLGGDFGWLYSTSEQFAAHDGGADLLLVVVHVEVGWPQRCWWRADRTTNSQRPGILSEATELWCVEVPLRMRPYLGVNRLPIGIHPLPFIANTLFYAAIPCSLWLTIGPLRRWRRRRAGRCTRCNYDRAGLAAGAVCPECGNAGGA